MRGAVFLAAATAVALGGCSSRFVYLNETGRPIVLNVQAGDGSHINGVLPRDGSLVSRSPLEKVDGIEYQYDEVRCRMSKAELAQTPGAAWNSARTVRLRACNAQENHD